MKKKILSTLLAACLFVGMAVPAVMAANSSKSGSEDKITTAKFDATNYVVANGDSVKLAEKLNAFCGKTAICEDPTVEYTLENNDTKFAFSIDEDGVASANEDSGTAKVTVSLNDGKVKTTTTLTAKKAVVKKDATSFTIAADAKMPGGVGAEDKSITLKPYPAGSAFTAAQLAAIKAGTTVAAKVSATANVDLEEILIAVDGSTATAINDDGNIVITVAAADLATVDKFDKKALEYILEVAAFPYGDAKTADIPKNFKAQGVEAVAATGVGVVKSSVNVEVGATVDPSAMFKALPSGANVGLGKSIGNDDSDDFAVVLANDKAKGYAVGKSKIACEIGGKVGYATINVVEAGSVQTATPAVPEKLTVAVGASAPLVATNFGDASVTWVFDDNGTIGLTNNNKTTTAVIGKKVGTSTIKATFSNGVTKTIAVTVTAAVAPAPGTGTDVPQTGDSLFANLFN